MSSDSFSIFYFSVSILSPSPTHPRNKVTSISRIYSFVCCLVYVTGIVPVKSCLCASFVHAAWNGYHAFPNSSSSNLSKINKDGPRQTIKTNIAINTVGHISHKRNIAMKKANNPSNTIKLSTIPQNSDNINKETMPNKRNRANAAAYDRFPSKANAVMFSAIDGVK